MFLQVFSKKVCFCCILGCFAEKKLPQMSQILTDGACLKFCEFCVLWEYSSPTDCTDQHRWLVAWVRQGCHTLLHLCKSVLSVGDPSLQEASVQICEICGRKSQREGSVQICEICGRKSQQEGCVGMAGMPYPPTLVLFNEHGGVGGDALHTTGEAELLCSCCLD